MAFTLLALAACGAADRAASVERTDSAGVTLVTSGALDVPFPWSARERFTLGGEEEGPASFYRLSRHLVGADDAGRLYVLDDAGHRVVVFGADGAPVRAVGREGKGPGELSRRPP